MKESPKAMDKTDNELIAKFMGVKEQQGFYDSYGQDEPFWYTANEHFRTHSRLIPDLSFVEFIEHCKYHTSWDWLMPAFDKFASLDCESDEYTTHCVWISEKILECDIQGVCERLVEAIKWYNSHNNEQ